MNWKQIGKVKLSI